MSVNKAIAVYIFIFNLIMKVFEIRSRGGWEGHVPPFAENVPQQVKSSATEKTGQNILWFLYVYI